MPRSKRPVPCPEKASLRERESMTCEEAMQVEGLFSVLANDSRLRLIHEIARHDEICTSDLAAAVDMKPQAVSNQLQRLQDKGIVGRRRDGNNVLYRIVDNCVVILLERGLCLVEETAKRAKR